MREPGNRFSTSDKILLPAVLLAFPLGVFGAHRFYLGRYASGILQLCTLGGLGIWAIVDAILLATGEFSDAEGRKVKNWVRSERENEILRLLTTVHRKLDRMEKRIQNLESLVISRKQDDKWDLLKSDNA